MDLRRDVPYLLPPNRDNNRVTGQSVGHENTQEGVVSNECDRAVSSVPSTPSLEVISEDAYNLNNAETCAHNIEDNVSESECDRFSTITDEEPVSNANLKLDMKPVLPMETEFAKSYNNDTTQLVAKSDVCIDKNEESPALPLSETVKTVSESDKKTECEAQIEDAGFQDSLSTLAKSYEDTEPVYLSGIVDHITKNDGKIFCNKAPSTEAVSEHNQIDDKFSVSDLMSNESVSDIFDKVYVMNSRERIFQTSSVHRDDLEGELTNSSSGSGSSDTDIKSDKPIKKTGGNLKRINENKSDDRETLCKKPRKGITFDSVSVYYFPRTQGFTCIPSQGGSTLGMSWNHSHSRKFSLGEHAAEQRRAHRQYCLQNFNSVKNWNETSTISSEDSDSDEALSDSEMEFENYNFLQPIPTRERRAMLRAAGIHKIDSGEKDECRSIRLSREFCGCTCQVYCDPERCVCAQAGIKCQVDRMNFPCSCTRDGCANENGRIEFNPVRVRTHYIHTLMRLEMEKKKENEDDEHSRSLMNSAENSVPSCYLPSPSSSPLAMNSNLINFSYHTNLQMWGNEYTSSIPSAPNRFNFGTYAANADQFGLGTAVDNQYHHSIARLGIASTSTPASMQYCNQLLPEESDDCSRMLHYGNMNSPIVDMNQDFVIRDLTNGSKSGTNEVAYDADSLIQSTDENFVPQLDNVSQSESLDTSAEASEETEKEESDSDNFGDIIKKTMVESVIA